MTSFSRSLVKFILGIFLFGLALWVNPIEGFAEGAGYYDFNSINFTTPYNSTITPNNASFNVADNAPITRFGIIPYSSFTCDVSLSSQFFTSVTDLNIQYQLYFNVDLLFTGYDGGAYSQDLGIFLLENNGYQSSYNISIPASCEGVPTGLRFYISNAYAHSWRINIESNYFIDGSIVERTGSGVVSLTGYCSFTDFSFDQNSSSSSNSTIINNTTSNLVPIGYSSLNFGLNGNTYFLGASRVFEPSYLSPLIFSYDFANSVQGVVSSAPLTLAMGGYDSPPNTAHASPIAVIGDTRAGEYELTIALCLSNSPSSAQLSDLTNLSNWGFEFNRGYSGQQFALPSNTRISYTNFTDSKTGYVYTSVYFYFTTPDYFDSFLIRKAPSLNNIRVGAFAFNKYTGTISDQLTQSNQQWDYQNPSHSSFSSANSSAASTVSAFSNIESDAFSNLDTAMSGAGVNDFNINVISTPLATVSAMINQTYNILPDLVKWLILAILVIGIFAVIISANNYVNKD